MKNFFILRILDLFKFIFSWLNLEYSEIRLIIQMKITLSQRKPLALFNQRKITRKKKKKTNFILSSLFLYGFLGAMFSMMIFFILKKVPFVGYSFFLFIDFIFIFLALISEFSISFLNTKDNDIILPTPIHTKSLNIAKNLYLFLFYFQFIFIMSLPMMIISYILFGIPTVIAFFFSVTLLLLFSIVLTSLIYGFILAKFSGEKLKDIINYFQIIGTIGVFLFYQVLVQSMNYLMNNIDKISLFKYFIYIPIAWFGAIPAFFAGDKSHTTMLFILLSFLISIVGYYLYIKFIAPYFEMHIFKIKRNSKKINKIREYKFDKFFNRFSYGAFYIFANRILTSERRLKLAILPNLSFAYIIAVFLPLIYKFFDAKDAVIFQKFSFIPLYFCGMIFLQVLIIIKSSENYKASWIFKYLPLKNPGEIIKGALVAAVVKYLLPIYAIAFLVFPFGFGIQVLIDLIVSTLGSIIVIFGFLFLNERNIPFSSDLILNAVSSSKSQGYLLAAFVFYPLAVGFHLLFKIIPFGYFILIPIQLVLIYLSWKYYFEIEWRDIKE